MRLISRLLAAVALAGLPVGFALASCSTGAVGVQACREIEEARCQIATVCIPTFDVDQCTRFYRDQCLNGIQNTTDTSDSDINPLAQPCIDALNAAAACVRDGGAGGICPGVDLVPGATCPEVTSSPITSCNLILSCPEALAACNFAAEPPDAGTDATVEDADAATDGDAATD